MLTLGSIPLDAAQLADIRKGTRLRARIDRNPELLARQVRDQLKKLFAAASESPGSSAAQYARAAAAGDALPALAGLPLIDKFQLQGLYESFIDGRDRSSYFGIKTSGSTGVPMEAWFDHAYYVSNLANLRRILRACGVRFRPLAAGLMHVTAFRTGEVCSFVMPALDYSVYHHVRIHLSLWNSRSELVRFVAGEAPKVLGGLPSALDLLAGFVEAEGLAGQIRPRAVLSYSEALLPHIRARLERVFAAPVYDEYGLTEVGGRVATECSAHAGFHVYAADYVVEAVDASGLPVPDGEEGELVVTNLFSRTVPIVRYRTGDRGVLSSERCRCGSVSQRIVQLRGREITRFALPGGGAYNPYDEFRVLLAQLPLRQFQMVQRAGGSLTLNYVAAQAVDGLAAAVELNAAVRRIHGKDLALRRRRRFDVSLRKFNSFQREG
jgi:phenylacetate-CoA ligase